ncbi:MAG: hypothetical protein EP146_00800 [Oscillibacter sp.]|nr:hypothetical protein [Oscillibacter sp.]
MLRQPGPWWWASRRAPPAGTRRNLLPRHCPTPRKAPWRWRSSRDPSIGLPPGAGCGRDRGPLSGQQFHIWLLRRRRRVGQTVFLRDHALSVPGRRNGGGGPGQHRRRGTERRPGGAGAPGLGIRGAGLPVSDRRPAGDHPEDLEGLRIRTAGLLELFESYIGCWGVRLYPSSYSDVMTPLSNGTYNGQESTLAEADAAGYQTVQTDVTIFPAFYEPAILTMNSDLYDSLPGAAGGGGPLRPGGHGGPAAPEPGAGGGDPGAVAGRGRHRRPCFDRGAVGGLPGPDGTALRPGGPGPSGLVCGLYAGVGGAVSPLLKNLRKNEKRSCNLDVRVIH